MAQPKDSVRIELTPEQRNQIRGKTGKDTEAMELTVEELEDRIAPAKITFRQ